ncbi:ParA family protein [Miniimonas sp. S16]|uniref:ParA family protein n=1 Tax=Miniimonas sp. S16 TaxID=2171623 RepID=UPI000D527633|nr:ParA family protein [Miniimonas sp. S16]
MVDVVDRTQLERVVAVINGKGGVGKTTLVANVAGLLARSGYRVLAVDVDPQGNLGLDLGFADTERDDAGRSLTSALLGLGGVEILRDVREGLDVIVGGSALHHAAAALASSNRGEPRDALARVLAPIAGEYDLVVVDCPPGNESLQTAAIAAARWAIVPAKADEGTARGLTEIAHRLENVLDINPDLDLLGVALFDVEKSATRVEESARRMIAETVGSEDAVFTASIRHSIAVAQQVRQRGVLVHELDETGRGEPEFWKILRGEAEAGERTTRTAATVADDLHALTTEIVARLTERETKQHTQEATA